MISTIGVVGLSLNIWMGGAGTVAFDGQVAKEGPVAIAAPTDLRAALQMTGGIGAEGDAKRIELRRADGRTEVVDITTLGPAPLVYPGDQVFVPVLDPSRYVSVSGAVGLPGSVDYRPGLTLSDVLSRAHASQDAGFDHIRITRDGGEVQTVDLTKDAETVVLSAGDAVEVPYAPQTASDRQLITIVVVGLLIILLLR